MPVPDYQTLMLSPTGVMEPLRDRRIGASA
jgi:hypothetical protein